jgi:hypothetical protein
MLLFCKNKNMKSDNGEDIHSKRDKILSALFYGSVSLIIIFTNKAIMTAYDFKHFDFLATVQFLTTTIILSTLNYLKKIEIPKLTMPIAREILPISFMFLGNVICGLGSTRTLNLPMFTALRRFSILMTMIAEYYVLNNKPSNPIILSVSMMVGGALFAALFDLAFDYEGYLLVFLNNSFTCLNGVWLKKASISGKCNKMGLLYYNSLFSLIAMFLFFFCDHLYVSSNNQYISSNLIKRETITTRKLLYSNIDSSKYQIYNDYFTSNINMETEDGFDINFVDNFDDRKLIELPEHVVTNSMPNLRERKMKKIMHDKIKDETNANISLPNDKIIISKITEIYNFDKWNNNEFTSLFVVASFMGTVLNYSIFLCTTINSALTTAVVGCLKNVMTTYIGMIIFFDYKFQLLNFIGLNISIFGSLYYTYITMWK